jgi:hypothetical protein
LRSPETCNKCHKQGHLAEYCDRVQSHNSNWNDKKKESNYFKPSYSGSSRSQNSNNISRLSIYRQNPKVAEDLQNFSIKNHVVRKVYLQHYLRQVCQTNLILIGNYYPNY